MRACVLAIVLVAFAQPAFASHRHHATHHASRHFSHHHHRAAPGHHGFAHRRSHDENSWGRFEGQREGAPAFAMRETFAPSSHGGLDAMIARHAAANGLPVSLVHRVVARESGYNPRARNRSGATGLMQIKPATARGMGYSGSAAGLLDAETNLTYAVRYLAGAFRAAGGNAGRAVALYQSGYAGRGGTRLARRSVRLASSAPNVVPATAPFAPWGEASSRPDMQSAPVGLNAEFYVAPEATMRGHRRHRHSRR